MKLPHKTLERKLFKDGYRDVIGVDEVGMGCLAGPVFVCAVSFNKSFFEKSHKKLNWLRESKLLLPHQREKFAAELLKEKGLKFQLANCSPKIIDKINIYQASRFAMKKAISKLNSSKQSIVLVDGKTKIPGLQMAQLPIIKGDRKIFAIACASLIAKVTRDKIMRKYAKKYPLYGFEKHKGYGTKLHNANLVKFGPCEIHRRSFAPVAKLL
jgi:ribonuclease HII